MSFVQEFGNGSTSATPSPHTVATPSIIPVGATLVMVCAITGGSGGTVPTATDAKGNTYTLVATDVVTATTSAAFMLYANITTELAAGDLISVTYSPVPTRSAINIAHFDETLTPGPNAVNDNGGASTATITAGPTGSVVVGSLVFGGACLVNSGRIFTATNGMTTLTKRVSAVSSGERAALSAYKYAAADGGQTFDGTLDSSGTFAAIVQTFTVDATPPVGTDAYSTMILADGPIGYWRLGESSGTLAVDYSGNGYDGTYIDGTIAQVPSLLSKSNDPATNFSGTAYMRATPPTTTRNMTAEAWVKITGPDAGAFFHVGLNNGWSLGIGGVEFGHGDVGRNLIGLYTGRRWIPTTVPLSDGIHHVAMSISPDGFPSIFLDGVLVYTDIQVSEPDIPSPEFYIASNVGDQTEGPRDFTGVVDEVVLYGSALTEQEIARHYATGAGTLVATNRVHDPHALIPGAPPEWKWSGQNIATGGWAGGEFKRLTATDANPIAGIYLVDVMLPDGPGTYYLSYRLRGSATSQWKVSAEWRRPDNSQTGVTETSLMPVTLGEWVEVGGVLTAPAETTQLTFCMYSQDTSQVVAGDTFDFDALLLVRSFDKVSYFDGDTPDTADYQYAWTGTPDASTSTKTSFIPSSVVVSDVKKPVTSYSVIVGGVKKPVTGRFVIVGGVKKPLT